VGTLTDHDGTIKRDDRCEIFISDKAGERGVMLGISCAGGHNDAARTPEARRGLDVRWNGDWTCAVKKERDEWRAEAAVPLKTLREAGLDTANLCVNVAAYNRCGQGPRAIFLTDPLNAHFQGCRGFRPLADKPTAPVTGTFTVRLHFAEPGGQKAGQRMFDVKLGDQWVLKDFDIVKEAGGPRRAVTKEFKGVKLKDRLALELAPSKKTPGAVPVLCGLEAVKEE
jgi:hypothetical protein